MGYMNYCKDFENIENYEKAKAVNFEGWVCHHRLETHNSDGERRLVDIARKELIALDMYYGRPANELIFMTRKEHEILHKKGKPARNKGIPISEEQKKKISEAHKGKHLSVEHRRKIAEKSKGRRPMLGKQHSEETKKRMSEARKGRPAWNKDKHYSEEKRREMSEVRKGRHYYNNGRINVWCFECPPGFVLGKFKGTHYYNDGKVCIKAKECPEGFVPGRLIKR